jgi:hypothetical protein
MMDTRLVYPAHNTDSGITPQNVKLALLNYASTADRPNPLEGLLIVDDYLCHELFPDSPYSRQIALMDLLIAIIKEQLIYHRNGMEILCQPPDTTQRQAFAAIKRDVKTNNAQLIGWAWVYYGFVRIDLDITQQMFAHRTRVDDRTIRRYQEATFSSITDILIHKEAAARRSRIQAQQALIKRDFAKGEITITLKPHIILEMLQADQALLYAFMELFKDIKIDNSNFSKEWKLQADD